jgi:Fe-S oxidoreductase
LHSRSAYREDFQNRSEAMQPSATEQGDEKEAVTTTPRKQYLYQIENPAVPNRVARFLEAFESILRHTNYGALLDMYARTHTRCGRCASSCQVYQATGDPKDIPCYRTTQILKIYQRYFTFGGWIKGLALGNGYLKDSEIDELIDSVYRCTACGRCTQDCPMGIDHALVTHLGRYILSEMRLAPKALQVSTRAQLEGESGNTSAVPLPALLGNLEFISEEIEEEKGIKIEFPVDKEGVEYVFFAPVSDYLMEAETLMGNAFVLHACGEGDNWTIGSKNYDAINYGLFYSDWILERNIKRLVGEVRRLRGRTILIGECGHASRTARQFVPVFGGDDPPPIVNCVELAHRKFKEGKLRFDPEVVKERVTYHDPCNIARSGWIVDQPRELLRAVAKNYVEISPSGRRNFCCGGGGGTVSIDEMHDFRMEVIGKKKAEQLRATGADIVIAPCANCKKQLREIIDHYSLPMQVMGLHDLLYRAIVL